MKFSKEIKNFFTPEECKEFIELGEAKGFSESLIRTRAGEVMDKSIRNNDRVVFDDVELANKLWGKIKDEVPQNIEGWVPYGLNERLRYYRYKDGQEFKPHVDGSHKIDDNHLSLITMLMYLNEEFDGGETLLILAYKAFKPTTGAVLLFDHKLLHCGKAVTNGVKYVLRTDVMYKKTINEEVAPPSL